MIITGKEAEEKALATVAELMCTAARTAPKTQGMDNIVAAIVGKESKDRLVTEMKTISQREKKPNFERDAACLEKTPLVVLIGTKIAPAGLSCGLCGYENCDVCLESEGMCVFNVADLGIALGSAVSVTANHRVDNRIMYSIGVAAVKLRLLGRGEEVKLVYGIPLSISGKNPFFDRGK
ncbi:MAG: DUF2148 domain-containing protein [bacterium]|nr:DUF2148 domain-containing protein [bacterium]